MSLSIHPSHVQVYSGAFVAGADYKKFDIVSATGAPGVFYYAKHDIINGGGASVGVTDGNGDAINGLQMNFSGADPDNLLPTFYTENATAPFELAGFKADQIIKIADENGAAIPEFGEFSKIISVEPSVLKFIPDGASFDGSVGWTSKSDEEDIKIKIIAQDQNPGESNDLLWSQNEFFFDPDYGATAEFEVESEKIDFGDGYFALYPRGINCVNAKFSLTFSNRTTREATCIMHFLENKLGQHEIDAPVDYLPYKQGISGFHWGGDSMYWPYLSTENMSKSFVARQFGHSLDSENSNTVKCVLENFDTSILRRSEQIWTERVDSWSESETYNKNDVVFVEGNHEFYYLSGEGSYNGTDYHPTGWNGTPSSENTPWSREFFWDTSIGLTLEEQPRLKEVTLGFSNYKQIYNDGINESLLSFDAEFKNRDEKETKAILHFLEQHIGTKSFSYTLPAPYDMKRRFICPAWKHNYVFKNTHDISATFVETPFNFTDEQFDNMVPATESRGGDLHAPKIVMMGLIKPNEKRRCRVYIKNMGDEAFTKGVQLNGPYEYQPDQDDYGLNGLTVGEWDSGRWKQTKISKDDRAVIDLSDDNNSYRVRLSPSLSNGPEGGLYFNGVDSENSQERFFQRNDGVIRSMVTAGTVPDSFKDSVDFINWAHIDNSSIHDSGTLGPADKAYFEVEFTAPPTLVEDSVYVAKYNAVATVDPGEINVSHSKSIVFVAYSGSKWRPHQLFQGSGRNSVTGPVKIRLSRLTVSPETKNTNPYIYYDGNFDGKINLTVDHTTLTPLDNGPGNETVVQWAISINGGRSWRMKSQPKNSDGTFADLNAFKQSWSNVEAGDVNIAICDLVAEHVLQSTITVPFEGKVGASNVLSSFNPPAGQTRSLYEGS